MSEISIQFKNQSKIVGAFKRFPADVAKAIAEGVRSSTVFLVGKAKEKIASGEGMWKAPLDTGAMRRGIHPVFEIMRAYIRPSTATPYASYVHEGTKSMQARPFFDITAQREEKSVQDFFLNQLQKAIDKLP